MKRVPLIAAVLVLSVAATIAAAEFGWLGGAGASSQREVRDLVSGQPVAQALVVTVDSYRPPLASLFASADPRRCRTIDFVRGDDAGRLPDGIQGGVAFVLAPGVQGLAPYLSPIQTGDAYALSAQRLQGGEGAEQFGPGYATESAAAAALTAYGIAGEIAAERAAGPGSFAVALIDALATLDPQTLQARMAGARNHGDRT